MWEGGVGARAHVGAHLSAVGECVALALALALAFAEIDVLLEAWDGGADKALCRMLDLARSRGTDTVSCERDLVASTWCEGCAWHTAVAHA